MEKLAEIKLLLASPKKIVITTHHKPDGDAIGSSLGLWHYLKAKGHEGQVITPTDYAHFLEWMPGNEEVIIFEQNPTKATPLVEAAELIFCLDFNQLQRINEMGELIAGLQTPKVMIDHHLDPDDFADFILSDTSASSTAQLIYQFIDMLGETDMINMESATNLYIGIMTDTGSFRYPNTTAEVHRITAALLDKGVQNTEAHELIFDSFSENRMRFFGYCITEKLQVIPEYSVALISVTAKELKRFHVKTGDSEGLVNFPLAIEGIVFAALIIDRTQLVKLSLRSKGDFPVNEICNKHFKGGGHKNAAGGSSTESLEATVKKFIKILPEYSQYLPKKAGAL